MEIGAEEEAEVSRSLEEITGARSDNKEKLQRGVKERERGGERGGGG